MVMSLWIAATLLMGYTAAQTPDPNAYIAVYTLASSSVSGGNRTYTPVPNSETLRASTTLKDLQDTLADNTNVAVTVDTCQFAANLTGSPAPPCDSVANCTEVQKSIIQCTCPSGYNDTSSTTISSVIPTGQTCTDIDECAGNTTVCGAETFNCTNSPGSYSCACNPGYEMSTSKVCVDLNECKDALLNNCTANATCTNAVPGFTCACDPGFTGDGVTSCSDVDECSPTDPCGSTGTCMNSVGSYTCNCNAGFMTNTTSSGVSCADIDECAATPFPCDVNADCSNSLGSFTCACKAGFTGNGTSCSGNPQDYCYRMEITVSGTNITSGYNDTAELGDLVGEIRNNTDLTYVALNFTFEGVTTSGSDSKLIVLVCFNAVTKTRDDLTFLLRNHSSSLSLNSLPVLSLDDYDECPSNFGKCADLSNCTNLNGSFLCECFDYTADLSTSGVNGTICQLPINHTCYSNRVEVHLLKSYYTNLNINLTDLELGGCSGTDDGIYWFFDGTGCTATTTDNGTHFLQKYHVYNVIHQWQVNSYVNFSVSCVFVRSQNISANFTSVRHDIHNEIPGQGVTGQTGFDFNLYMDDLRTTLIGATPIKTNQPIYGKVSGRSTIPPDFDILMSSMRSFPAVDPGGWIRLVENDCPVSTSSASTFSAVAATVSVTKNGNGDEVLVKCNSHFFGSHRVTTLQAEVSLCQKTGGSSCGNTCPAKRKRSVVEFRMKRQASEFAESSFVRDPDDVCNRDCGSGACVLDALQNEQCVCVHNARKVNGVCLGPEDLITETVTENRITLWVLIGLAIAILVLVAVLAVAFILRRRKGEARLFE